MVASTGVMNTVVMSRCTVIQTFWVFFSEKIIVGPQEVRDPRFLLQLAMTHYILGSICFRTPPDPPIWLETQKCAIFGPFWSFHLKSNPKVGVHRVKFNIGHFAQLFFGGFYICWDYVISFSQHFPMKKFSPSPSTSPSPPFHPLFENWLQIANKFFKIILDFIRFFS